MVVFKIIALDLLVIRHCRVNCIINKNFVKRYTFIWESNTMKQSPVRHLIILLEKSELYVEQPLNQ